MLKNNKGMTLVEIVIVLLIASIAMTITGAILVNSLGYFDDNTKKSLDKQIADGALEYINGEIKYATTVTVTDSVTDKPDSREDWHCLYIANHEVAEDETNASQNQNTKVLYRDGSEVFSIDYYSKRNLNLQVKGFTANERRLDMLVILNDKNNQQVYRTSNTYELLNLNMQSDDSKTTTFWGNIATEYFALSYSQNDTNNKVLWYIKDASYKSEDSNNDGTNNGDVDSTGDGTVADIIKNIDSSNYLGLYYEGIGYHYNYRDIVWYNGYFWQKTANENDQKAPGTEGGSSWKCLRREYNKTSSYDNGDIVIYKDYYYRCVKPDDQYYDTSFNPKNGSQWQIIGRVNDPEAVEEVKKNIYEKQASVKSYANVLKNHLSSGAALQDPLKSGYDLYVIGKSYKEGSIIKKVNDHTDQYYDLWIAGKDTSSAPGTPASGWIKLDNIYDSGSSYTTGDIVYCKAAGDGYVKAKINIFEDNNPGTDIYNEKKYWEQVNTWS